MTYHRRLAKIWRKIFHRRIDYCRYWFRYADRHGVENDACGKCPIMILNRIFYRDDTCVKLTVQKRVWWRISWWIEARLGMI